MRTAIV